LVPYGSQHEVYKDGLTLHSGAQILNDVDIHAFEFPGATPQEK